MWGQRPIILRSGGGVNCRSSRRAAWDVSSTIAGASDRDNSLSACGMMPLSCPSASMRMGRPRTRLICSTRVRMSCRRLHAPRLSGIGATVLLPCPVWRLVTRARLAAISRKAGRPERIEARSWRKLAALCSFICSKPSTSAIVVSAGRALRRTGGGFRLSGERRHSHQCSWLSAFVAGGCCVVG